MEIGVLACEGDDGHGERIVGRVDDCQRHAVNCYRAFVHAHVSASCHCLVGMITEGEIGAAVGVSHVNALRRLVDVALDYVSVEAAIDLHGPLYVDLVANGQLSDV